MDLLRAGRQVRAPRFRHHRGGVRAPEGRGAEEGPSLTRPLTSRTRVAAVIGDPVEHSLSPVIHNAAFEALELDWIYVAFPVPAGSGGAAVEAMRTLGVSGLSVTMPHKQDVAAAVDRLSPAAAVLGAVNTVVRLGDELVGETTDGNGFLDALAVDEGLLVAGRRCAVLGAGGAARAVIHALAGAGAADIVVANRTKERAEAAVTVAGRGARTGDTGDVRDAELVVNATPIGMDGVSCPVDPALLHEGQVVVDLIYRPPLTPLLIAARDAGAVAVNGLGMLIHQAAHQFRLWTGEEPPLEVMSAAALRELARTR